MNRNTRELLGPLLKSIEETAGGLSLELILVDNGSEDGSVEFVCECFPGVRVLRNGDNLGFAAANNRGIALSSGRCVLLANTDIVVLPGALRCMYDFITGSPTVGAVGCKVLNPDGTLQLSGKTFPDPVVGLYIGLGIHKIFPNSRIANRYYLSPASYEERQEVHHVSGSFMMVSREAVEKVGPLDEAFFLYCEDVDWCARIRAEGYKIFYLPEARVIHYKGRSSAKESRRMIQEYHRSAWRFYQKYYAKNSPGLLTAAMFLGIRARLFWLLALDALSRRKGVRY